MMRYFTECKTIEDVKRMFKEFAKNLHPDNGGDAEEFKVMMQEYEKAFNIYKNIHINAEGKTYTKETTETPEQFAAIINKVIWMEDVKVEIIGSWVWLSGNTMMYKDEIKSAGFWWSKSKRAWYYNSDNKGYHKKGHYSMEQLREKWGSETVENKKYEKLA